MKLLLACAEVSDARVEAIRIHMVSIVVSIQAIFQPFPPSRPPDKPRGLSM
jgi:hypothetical protein